MQIEASIALSGLSHPDGSLLAEVRATDSDLPEVTITVCRNGETAPVADLVLGLHPDTGELRVLLSTDGDASEHRLCLFPLRPAIRAACPL